ncbi:MAG: FAD-dependent oxidoreductase [Jatrophihabitans sp.]|uniref:FAD-dependent oxidoreductase n=1 Tax=Jatrophihabitans sp. TaxID=1932789 RepID=UPI003F7D56D6
MRIVVVGGSAAGLFAGLLLARDGHEVTVVDRDDLTPPDDLETAAAAAFRPAAPHLVQPHAALPLFRELMLQHLRDVHAALLAAGAIEAGLGTLTPTSVADRAPRHGDERIRLVMTRRSTLDWVLRRAAAIEPGLTVRHDRVTGLAGRPGARPQVTGVLTDGGRIDADLVVDASGRRSAGEAWLGALGGRLAERERAECGLTYFSRHYRVRPGAATPLPPGSRLVLPLDHCSAGVWWSDNDTLQIALFPLAEDKRFRTLIDPVVFTEVLRTIPAFAGWPDCADPITPVFAMAGLHNTYRPVLVEGRSPASGWLPLGDAVCTTNPTFGRGLGLALRQAVGLAEAVRADDRPDAVAAHYAATVQAEVEPFYRDQARNDQARLALLRHTVFGAPRPLPSPQPASVSWGELAAASVRDADALRAMWRVFGMLERPDAVYRDPAVVARVRAVNAEYPEPLRPAQPTARQLELALAR